MKTALLFPGQGSQKVGMGRALAERYEAAQAVFQEADDALGYPISTLCFEGPEADLTLTRNTQPAILTTSIAALRALEAAHGPLDCDVVAGHSLGEWTALVAAGALRFADAVKLVHLRGKAMQDAVPAGQGAMAALMGLDADGARALCLAAADGQVCAPANLNGGGQIVISGHADAIDRALAMAREHGAKRAVKLQVSAPFHCKLMQPAAETLAEALAGVEMAAPRVPVVTNVEATACEDPAQLRLLLTEQVTAPVRWEESVQAIASLGVTRACELGAGSVLRGLVRRIARDVEVTSIGEPADIEAFAA